MKFLQLALISSCIVCGLSAPSFAETAAQPPAAEVPKERELQLLYDTAREFYRDKKYYGARALLLEIQQTDPNYRYLNYYLAAVEQKIASRRSGSPVGTDAGQIKQRYNEGIQLYRDKNYAEAVKRFRAVMEVSPGYFDTENYLARTELAIQGQGGAVPTPPAQAPKEENPPAEKPEKTDPVARLLDEAHRLESAGKTDEAASLARIILGMDTGNQAAKRQLARLESAAAKSAAEAKPRPKPPADTTALEKQADELYRQGKLKEARELYAQVLSARPSSRIAAAMINVIDRRLQAETTPPETAQKVDRSSRNALLNRARSAAEKGDYAHARELLVDLLMENPDDREAKTLLSRLELADAKARSKEHEREIETADAAKTAEEEKQLKELRKLVADREFEKAAKKADKLLKERPHWPEVETIQTLALHTIEADKERWLDLKGDLLDHQALRELEEASIPPKDPGTIPRPEVVVHKTPLQLESIQQRLQQKVSVNLVEADLSYVLDLLFRATGINIVANPAMLQGQQITIHVEQMPLQELLSYISRNYNILFSATSSAVWVSTPDQPFLETQIRQLTKGLTDVQEQVESTSSDVEKLMERVPELIDWPAGSSYYLDRKRNVLFLRSTPEALSKVNELINEIDNDPLQILIETRFVELQADYFKDFDLDYWLTDKFAVVKEDGAAKIQIDANTGVRWSKLANPLGHLQDGLTGAVSGVLTNPQFEVAIKLLEESNKAKTLSAPRILALNNYTSEIEITKDLIYIEDYEVDRADISGSTVGGTGTTGAAGNSTLSSEPVIIPQFSTGEETGFLLRVTPSVGADHRLITLVLEPEISEEVERMSFNLVIPDYEGDAPIERPIVSRRKLTTKATVADGHVLVLAGLMTSQKSKRESKIPVLGNIPLIGRLFRSDSEVDSKTNLLIFVKATILDGEGRRYHDAGREGAEAGEVGALREDDEFDFATRPE